MLLFMEAMVARMQQAGEFVVPYKCMVIKITLMMQY